MKALKIIITPENRELMSNVLLVPSVICLNALKYSWEFQANFTQQETILEDCVFVDLFFEKDHSEDELEQIKSSLGRILLSFFRVADETVNIEWQIIN